MGVKCRDVMNVFTCGFEMPRCNERLRVGVTGRHVMNVYGCM